MPHPRIIAALIVIALATAPGREASAGDGETFYMGGDAALLGGAVTSSTSGASALWYNPARLGEGSTDSVDVAVSAYAVRVGDTPELRPGSATVRPRSFSGPDILAAPTAAAYSRRILGLDVGFGLFVPTVTSTNPRSLATVATTEGQRAVYDASSELTEYYLGMGVGRRLARGLWLGASVFGYLAEESLTEATGTRGDGGAFTLRNVSWDQQSYGLQGGLGLAYMPSPEVMLGLSLRSPVVRVARERQGTGFAASGEKTGATVDIYDASDTGGAAPALLAPARASLGVSGAVAPRVFVALDVRVRGPLSSPLRRVADPVVDLRIGARARLSDECSLGLGIFSDRSSSPGGGEATWTKLDFYGASMALELGSPYRVLNADGIGERLHIATSLALSYAFGSGTIVNRSIEGGAGGLSLTRRHDDAIAHELVLTIGTSLSNLVPGR